MVSVVIAFDYDGVRCIGYSILGCANWMSRSILTIFGDHCGGLAMILVYVSFEESLSENP